MEDVEGAAAEPVLQINGDRLWATLMELKEIGSYDDAATGLRGVTGRPPCSSSGPELNAAQARHQTEVTQLKAKLRQREAELAAVHGELLRLTTGRPPPD
jgi:hypothetical protein